ncbi:MAG: hypothetical protein B6241_08825 [Spirochaetaceae bacterium 4572_59]|nr:MAG: hypothetical protein B6241_08825 [Spirochaetaceae bacterium 4572_59]
MEEKGSTNALHIQIFLRSSLYFILMLIVSFLIFFVFTRSARNRRMMEYKMKAMTQLEYQSGLMQNHFQSVRSDILFLPQLNEVLRFTEVRNEDDLIYIEKEFLAFTRSKLVYDQIRYIDSTGTEQVRINFNDGHPSIVRKGDLQVKSDRYYFVNTMSLQRGEVYTSPFDLNKEKGTIEQPLKPMIRFGTPVFDNQNSPKGIIILNYLGDTLLQDLKVAGENNLGQLFLLNKEGYWLYHDDPEFCWGFMYPQRQNLTLRNRSPEVWKTVSSSMKTQFIADDTLITSLILTPFPEISSYQQEQSWILMNTISLKEMGLSKKFLTFNQSYILLTIVFLSAVLSWFLGRAVIHRNIYRDVMEYSALYDPLTGLPNRKLLKERARQLIEEARRYSRSYALIFIDLDGFKAVNDTLGHEAGDDLLKQAGERMLQSVRSSDSVYRFGGDEFIILLSQIENRDDCGKVGRKILKNISREFSVIGGKAKIGASIGIAMGHSEATDDLESLIQKADKAMYDVKGSGKNNCKIV